MTVPILTVGLALDQEDRSRLDRLIGALEALAPKDPDPVPAAAEAPQPPAPAAPPAPQPELEPAPKPVCTKEQLQKEVIRLSAAGYKPAVREIVTGYAPKVTDIPPDKYDEVMTRLKALEKAA